MVPQYPYTILIYDGTFSPNPYPTFVKIKMELRFHIWAKKLND